ncbi:MAG: iron-sulfur cluster assembly scaffold protein [Parcubacteria group bacterium]|nr:iron-sulfur cluster assembly scaffold protein [Parcubacteria group bacterium]
MDLYGQNILDHYKNPRNHGRIPHASVSHEEANYTCGDSLVVDIEFLEDRLKDLKFEGQGCAISQAAMSILSEEAVGMKKKEVLGLALMDMKDMLGIPLTERRTKCALLGLLTLQNAILKYERKALRHWFDLIPE